MRRILALIITFSAQVYLFAQPNIAVHMRLQATACRALQNQFPNAPYVPEGLKYATQLEVFLLSTPEQTLQPVIFVKSPLDAPNHEHPIPLLQFNQIGDWMVGTFGNYELSADDRQALLTAIAVQPPTEFFVEAKPSLLITSLRKDPAFNKKIADSILPPLFDELSTLDSIQLRGQSSPRAPLRLVLIAKANPTSALYTLFSQRLPNHLPPEHKNFPIANFPIYGYLVFNTNSVITYYDYLAQHYKAPCPEDFRALFAPASGYCAFAYDQSLSQHEFLLGKWNSESAPRLISQQCTVFAATGQLGSPTVQQSFYIGETPIWKATLNNNPLTFFGVENGNLVCAPTAESLTTLLETLHSNDPVEPNLTHVFTHYPTLVAQAKIHPAQLAKALSARSMAPSNMSLKIPDTPIYVAASLSSGQCAVTADIPPGLIQALADAMKPQKNPDAPLPKIKQSEPSAKPVRAPVIE